MENASEAIIIAGSIFLLIIALTLSINSFSRVKTQIDDIVLSHDKVEYAVDSDNKLINFIESKKKYTRTVQFETIVTTLRRIRKESFDVYIITNENIEDLAAALQDKLHENYTFEDIQVSADEDIQVSADKTIIRFTLSGEANKYVEDKNSDNFDKALNLLYNEIGDKKFKEFYGIYKEKTQEGVSDIEKTDNKIITYLESNE